MIFRAWHFPLPCFVSGFSFAVRFGRPGNRVMIGGVGVSLPPMAGVVRNVPQYARVEDIASLACIYHTGFVVSMMERRQPPLTPFLLSRVAGSSYVILVSYPGHPGVCVLNLRRCRLAGVGSPSGASTGWFAGGRRCAATWGFPGVWPCRWRLRRCLRSRGGPCLMAHFHRAPDMARNRRLRGLPLFRHEEPRNESGVPV